MAGSFFNLVPLIVFFPVIGLLINILIGKRLGEKAVGAVASSATGLAFVISVLQAISLVSQPEGTVVPFLEWIKVGDLNAGWAFQVDTLSVTMMLVVSGVGTLIHIYAIGYMHDDVRHNGDPARYPRFFVYLNLFIAAMMVLVSADNYLMLFVGWEGVGLCSYLLIGFWFEKGKDNIGNAIAAKKAFIANRVGDFGFLLGLFTMFWAFNSLNFKEVIEKAPQVAPATIVAITLFMLVGVTGKSAQIPLYVWLPDAMAGPTPVSALIHAATMVTAGVYVVARSHALYALAPAAQNTVALVGAVTALYAAMIAVGQFDIKKVLAYSTISQLGFMVAAVGMGAFVAGMFHLIMHAFFKALLFLSAGSVIHGVEEGHHHVEHDPRLKKKLKYGQVFDPQDMRNMGGLRKKMPVTFWLYLIGGLALAGIPPLSGFWSKDEILAEASHLNPAVYVLLTIAALFTALYVGRQIWLVFFAEARTAPAEHASESPPLMTIPLMVLGFLALFGGFINLPAVETLGKWLDYTLGAGEGAAVGAGAAAGAEAAAAGGFNPLVAAISIALAVAGLATAWYLYDRRYRQMQSLPASRRPDDPLRGILGPIFVGMENKWWIDELYAAAILKPYIWLSKFLAETIDWRFWHDWFHDKVIAGGFNALTRFLALPVDMGIIDGIANGLGRLIETLAGYLRRVQTGFVRNYALSVFIGVVLILGYLILR